MYILLPFKNVEKRLHSPPIITTYTCLNGEDLTMGLVFDQYDIFIEVSGSLHGKALFVSFALINTTKWPTDK